MSKRVTQLSDAQVRTVKPKSNVYKLFDGGGLFLSVMPNGGKLWRFKYRFGGKEKKLSLGTYPEISLSEARQRKEEARKQIANGIDPGVLRKAQKQAETTEKETFEVIAREWHLKFSTTRSPGHSVKVLHALERDVFPWIGKRSIAEIKAPELLTVLRRVESRGTLETAHRLRGMVSQIFRYAVATGRADRDPAHDLIGAIPQPREKHYAAITDPKEVGALLRAMDGYKGSFVTKCALILSVLTFVRPGELRHCEWVEINLDSCLWTIPGKKMKMGQDHIIPLSPQAVEILNDIKPLTGNSRYVFPSERSIDRAMSENTTLGALRRLGYGKNEMTPHGFRAMARTIIDEVLHVRPDIIEHQLAHAVRDPLGTAYNRTSHLEERKGMMQKWADYLDGLKAGAVVIPFKTAKG